MLQIENLHAQIGDTEILRGVEPRGGGGRGARHHGAERLGQEHPGQRARRPEAYDVTGQVLYEGQDLLALSPEDRAAAGVFLAFQHPVEIPGVGNLYFLRTALNSVRRQRGLDELDAMDFLALAQEQMKLVEMDRSFMSRSVNEGFSGGEKKRNEILQMAILEPKLAILDETDSGLDIDALRVVADGVNALRSQDRAMLRDHPPPAAPRLHRPRPGPCHGRRPDRPLRRQGPGARRSRSTATAASTSRRPRNGRRRWERRHDHGHRRRPGAVSTPASPSANGDRSRLADRGPPGGPRVGHTSTGSRRPRTRTGATRGSGRILEVPFEPAGAGVGHRVSSSTIDALVADLRRHPAGLRQRLLRPRARRVDRRCPEG